MNELKYPATAIHHWASGLINACNEHGDHLVKLSQFMGYHVRVSELIEPAECTICINKNKDSK